MLQVAKKITRGYFVQLYFFCLFMCVGAVYWPSLFHPPRSDYWSALYFFYRLDMIGGFYKWHALLTYDPLINVTFRPLCFLFLYLERLVVGPHYLLAQLLSLLLYYATIVALYFLAKLFCKDISLILLFLTVFAFLFSHFDLVCWAYHSHILVGFLLFLSGFILYVRYRESGKKWLGGVVAALFLVGMLLYEIFLLWPLALAIIHYSVETNEDITRERSARKSTYLWVIGTVYLLYAFIFLLERLLRLWLWGRGVSLSHLFLLYYLLPTVIAIFFNILYNNILVNLFPWFAYPLNTADNNLNMGGVIGSPGFDINTAMYIGGTVAILLTAGIFVYVAAKKRRALGALVFLFYLLVTELLTLFWFKSLVNSPLYHLTQFRYQFIPNAIVTIIAITLFGSIVRFTRLQRIALYATAALVIISNAFAVTSGISFLGRELLPLREILYNIKTAIAEKRITKDNRLFLDDAIAEHLPSLCWNRHMGQRCMRGTFQWFFSKKDILLFSPRDEAKWVLDKKDYTVIPK